MFRTAPASVQDCTSSESASTSRPPPAPDRYSCHVFELYRQMVPRSRFTMDRFIRLMIALSEGEDLQIGHCRNCHGALLVDRLGASRRLCPACKQDSLQKPADTGEVTRPPPDATSDYARDEESPAAYQQPLFMMRNCVLTRFTCALRTGTCAALGGDIHSSPPNSSALPVP